MFGRTENSPLCPIGHPLPKKEKESRIEERESESEIEEKEKESRIE